MARRIAKPKGWSPEKSAIWDEVVAAVKPAIGSAGLIALCDQIQRQREAARRIDAEGIVIADARGNPVPHPAVAVERAASSEILKWIAKFGYLDDYD